MAEDDAQTPEGEPSDEAEPVSGMVNAADPASVKRARTKAKLRQEQTSDVVRRAFSTEPGRRERWEILAAHGTFEPRFGVGPNGFPQPEVTFYNLGARDVGFNLWLSWMRIDPVGVAQMMQENHSALAEQKPPKGRRAQP